MNKPFPAWGWAILSGLTIPVLGWVDWHTGYEFNFFLFYFLPVSVSAWFVGLGPSVIMALFSALVWFGADYLSAHAYSSPIYAVWNTTVRLGAFLAIGWSISRMRHALDRERHVTETLRRALSEIKVLETFLPICAQCKKIRDERGSWQPLETYIGAHSNTQFSHGYCPECARRAMEEAGLAAPTADL